MKPGAVPRLVSNSWSCETLAAGLTMMAARKGDGETKQEPDDADTIKKKLIAHRLCKWHVFWS